MTSLHQHTEQLGLQVAILRSALAKVEALCARIQVDAEATTTAQLPPRAPEPDGAWCTVGEAADYLRLSDDAVTRRLVPFMDVTGRVEGKLRYMRVGLDGSRSIRVLTDDVHAVMPKPD